MAKSFIILMLISLGLSTVHGQFLQNKVVKATKPVDKKCLAHLKKNANSNSKDVCEFFKCFEERFPCGSEYWIINWGYKYCTRYTEISFFNKFTESGKKLLNHINTCLPQSLKRAYRKRSHNCKRLQNYAFKAQGRCYAKKQKLFCEAFPENSKLFTQVLDQSDFFNMDSVKMIKQTAENCKPKIDLVKLMFD